MARIAFYAPLKSPNHPTPSGDRQMARNLMRALQGASGQHDVTLVSELRCYEGKGDFASQADLIERAGVERENILAQGPFDLWVSYHNYYKAPDLLGPQISKTLGIPYVLFEATRARKRLQGPWADFAARAEAANDAADLIFHFTARDGIALHEQRFGIQKIAPLPPFLPQSTIAPLQSLAAEHQKTLLSVGMMRGPDKFASYQRIAETLDRLTVQDWQLRIVGDGPRADEVKALFSRFGPKIEFLGQLSTDRLAQVYQNAALFLWPGVNEAFGMVYLEAQAAGCPAIAEDRPGVRDVLPASAVYPEGDTKTLAQAIDHLLSQPDARSGARSRAAKIAHEFVQARHLFPAAQDQIFKHITPFLSGR